MQIDIRDTSEEVTEIRFSGTDVLRMGDKWLDFHDNDGNEFQVLFSDIDNLMLALQKAKELWSK